MEYDWRHRFHLSLEELGWAMQWGEAHRLVQMLLADPSSAISASLAGWSHPISREALILMDHYDLDHQVAAGKKKVKGHPMRPTPPKDVKRTGDAAGRTPDEVRDILRRARDGELTDT